MLKDDKVFGQIFMKEMLELSGQVRVIGDKNKNWIRHLLLEMKKKGLLLEDII